MDDPIADSARSILDGHIVLSRKIAQKNHFPAIDILASASRVFRSVTSEAQQDFAGRIKEWMALYSQAEDLINIGAYAKGSNPKIDQAIGVNDRINQFLRQKIDEVGSIDETLAQMQAIVRVAENIGAARR
jgi:flagellum-specific ATP synthase